MHRRYRWVTLEYIRTDCSDSHTKLGGSFCYVFISQIYPDEAVLLEKLLSLDDLMASFLKNSPSANPDHFCK